MKCRELIIEKFKIEAMITELDIEMLYLKEEKYNLQRDIDNIDKELSNLNKESIE